ncbi:LOW QUALITY PROTEIN: hypothetical protein ACHAWF_006105, partial [Thalassiosira exigua]
MFSRSTSQLLALGVILLLLLGLAGRGHGIGGDDGAVSPTSPPEPARGREAVPEGSTKEQQKATRSARVLSPASSNRRSSPKDEPERADSPASPRALTWNAPSLFLDAIETLEAMRPSSGPSGAGDDDSQAGVEEDNANLEGAAEPLHDKHAHGEGSKAGKEHNDGVPRCELADPMKYPDAGLDDGNYCRNPPMPDYDERAWCYSVDDDHEYCDVPTCDELLPSSYPSSSVLPSQSSRPTSHPSTSSLPSETTKPSVSLSPTPEPECKMSNPAVCGCAEVGQSDYRGTIDVTATGRECGAWPDLIQQQHPDAGLDDGSYCRNAWPDYNERAWCYSVDGVTEYCDVPTCEELFQPSAYPSLSSVLPSQSSRPTSHPSTSSLPSESLKPSVSISPTARIEKPQCAGSNPKLCGCATVNQADYRGSINVAKIGAECMRWDEVEDRYWLEPFLELYHDALEENFCRNPDWDGSDWPENCVYDQEKLAYYNCCADIAGGSDYTKGSCDCIIKPGCKGGNSTKCKEFAQHCCRDHDNECKCKYQREACRLALEQSVPDAHLKHCMDAEQTCCGNGYDLYYPVGGCACDFWEPLFNAFPNDACDKVSGFCCAGDNVNCKCDLYTYAVENLGSEYEGGEMCPFFEGGKVCTQASNIRPDHNVELKSLGSIYTETSGEHWHDNAGWMNGTNYCQWYDITCESEFVTKIELPSNNLTGEFPANSLSKLYKTKTLDLANNSLWGTMAGTYVEWVMFGYDGWMDVDDTSVFFNLRDLSHVDFSQNKLSGEVDVLFAPALEHANFSQNNFTSINSFKKFKRSHQTLKVCDLSYNFIHGEASNILKNVPPNIERLILSNNLIDGPLPTSLESMPSLREFNLDSNRLNGTLPDFSSSFPNLRELDLSNQKQMKGFTGPIPESLANLPFLSVLNVAGNNLTSTVPPALGTLAQIRELDLSNNNLSRSIPKELGRLA